MKTITIILEGKEEELYEEGIKLIKRIRKKELGPEITNAEHSQMLVGGLTEILAFVFEQMNFLYKGLNK